MPWDAQAEYLAGLQGVYWDDAAHERLTQVILSHARDALAGTPERGGRETTLGDGRVDLLEYLSILSAAGYGGPQIIRRSGSERPLDDLAAAKEYLEAQVG